ncbi:MAG: amidase domain-containing protein [Clostridia bacterium]|nr:amidase domain-containing protein [Clostridia bacterium]
MLVERRYNRENALEYARRWAFERNPLFYNYTGQGGDCTNFISQCLLAGSCQMNFTPIFGWFYLDSETRTASWTGVEFFYNFIVGNTGVGPYGVESNSGGIDIGDVVQLANDSGDYYHTLFISGISDTEGILVAAHSDDAFDRPLSSYNYASARFIHILGVRFEIEFRSDACFEALLNGERIVT